MDFQVDEIVLGVSAGQSTIPGGPLLASSACTSEQSMHSSQPASRFTAPVSGMPRKPTVSQRLSIAKLDDCYGDEDRPEDGQPNSALAAIRREQFIPLRR